MSKTTRFRIEGNKYNLITVLKFVPTDHNNAYFWCACDCGNEKLMSANAVVHGKAKSCGCEQRRLTVLAHTKHGHNKNKGLRSSTYGSWASMMDRCEWGGHKIMYSNYGAKGIRVCTEWFDFSNFLKDMGERPDGTSIDRIDNEKGYYVDNCRWATNLEQALNRKTTIKVRYNGSTEIVHLLCGELGLSIKAVRARATRRGNDYVKALRSLGIQCDYV